MHDDRARQQPRRDRSVNERAADHAAIDRLADELLPALVAKLSATGLGEIEVREGRGRSGSAGPAGGAGRGPGRGATDRPSRAQPGHAGHGHSPAAFEGPPLGARGRRDRPAPTDERRLAAAGGRRSRAGPATGGDGTGRGRTVARSRSVATSPAVGVYNPRPTRRRAPGPGGRSARRGRHARRRPGGRRAGRRAGRGEPRRGRAAVEYGQELVVIELAGDPARAAADPRRARPECSARS